MAQPYTQSSQNEDTEGFHFSSSLNAQNPSEDLSPPEHLGDLCICLEKASENSNGIGHDLDREVCFLIIHGILHLCGYDHIQKEEEQLMLEQQHSILSYLEEKKPPSPMWKACVQRKTSVMPAGHRP